MYVHSEGRLYWKWEASPHPEAWEATSGPWGNGVAPPGAYRVVRPAAIAPLKVNIPYTDKCGFAWFASLEPLFVTDRKSLGLHADGGVPGTRGCIGLKVKDTRPFFDYLVREFERSEPVMLYVIYPAPSEQLKAL